MKSNVDGVTRREHRDPKPGSETSSASTRLLLNRLLSQPTAPFREGWVIGEIKRLLTENRIPHFSDAHGNLVAGARSPEELSRGFRIGLMAHMDHPGFHLGERIGKNGNLWRCYFHGGAPFTTMTGHAVRLFDPADRNRTVRGLVRKVEKVSADAVPIEVEFDSDISAFTRASFGCFDFAGCEIEGTRVSTRGADDLAGCVIAIGALLDQEETLDRVKPKGARHRRLIGLFTRAEEVGFVGCLDLLAQTILPKGMWVLSLEASKALPEAEIDKGPVLRIGDKASIFDSEFCSVLWSIARDLESETANSSNPFRYQRRLMSGGTCEATALALFGHVATGLAVPLLNYHNQGDGKPAPEQISWTDVDFARALCRELGLRLTKKPNWQSQVRKRIVDHYRTFKPLLKERITYDGEA